MDIRTAEAIAGELNAVLDDWYLPIGGGSPALASEVRVRRYSFADGVSRVGIQARVERAWYWLLDGQIETLRRSARAVVA